MSAIKIRKLPNFICDRQSGHWPVADEIGEFFVRETTKKGAKRIAILKHYSVHNSNYYDAVLYLTYEHDGHARPVYDEHGLMIERENLLIDGINTDVYSYGYDCSYISRKYGKNRSASDIKSHHWILSFDPKDVAERGLTVQKAHQLGMEFAAKHFGGFHCIVATHQDGNNGSGNIHVHICHGSVRCKDVPQPRYSDLKRDSKAGYKLHVTPRCLHYLKEQVMLLCLQNGLHQIELNKHGQRNITDREYWADKRGQERADKAIAARETSPSKPPTKFRTELEKLRKAIEAACARSTSVEQFQRILREEYHITVKESRGRWSYLPEGRERAITWRKLGDAYKKEAIEAVIAANLHREKERQVPEEKPAAEQPNRNETSEQSHTVTPQTHHSPEVDEDFFLYGRIIDLNSPKVQESYSLLQWSKIQNLKENARRFAYMTENGLLNVDRLATELSRTRKAFYQKQSQQVAVEKRLKEVNGLLRDMAAFYETKKVYDQFESIKNPHKQKQFYAEHEREIQLNKAAIRHISQYRKDHKQEAPPTFPVLKKEKAALLKEQERLNGERKALKKTMQGMSEAYRAIDEQVRQAQRQRQRGTVQRQR